MTIKAINKLQCKNHINLSDLVPNKKPIGGFGVYGMWFGVPRFIIKFPGFFYHQIVCIDNPTFHRLTMRTKTFDRNWYKKYLSESIRNIQTIKTQKVKKETIV